MKAFFLAAFQEIRQGHLDQLREGVAALRARSKRVQQQSKESKLRAQKQNRTAIEFAKQAEDMESRERKLRQKYGPV